MTTCATCSKPLTSFHARIHPQPKPLPEWRRRPLPVKATWAAR